MALLNILEVNSFFIYLHCKQITLYTLLIGCFQIEENHIHSFPAVVSIGYCKQKCDSENVGSYFGYRQKVQDVSIKLKNILLELM